MSEPNQPKKELTMEQRLMLAFGLMGVVLLVSTYVMPKPPPEPPKQPAQKQESPKPDAPKPDAPAPVASRSKRPAAVMLPRIFCAIPRDMTRNVKLAEVQVNSQIQIWPS